MNLGILVNSDKHLDHVVGLAKAAGSKDHRVTIFVMDQGTRLLDHVKFAELASKAWISVVYCDHSAGRHGINTEGLPDAIVCGSQLNNSMMNHEADRVIVL